MENLPQVHKPRHKAEDFQYKSEKYASKLLKNHPGEIERIHRSDNARGRDKFVKIGKKQSQFIARHPPHAIEAGS